MRSRLRRVAAVSGIVWLLHLTMPVVSGQSRPFQIYELYSWPDTKDGWHFCLLPGTSMVKSVRVVFDPRRTARGVDALQKQIATLAGATDIFWIDRLPTGSGPKVPGSERLAFPPEDIITQVRQATERHHITLRVSRPRQ